jgi:hypothetical protein
MNVNKAKSAAHFANTSLSIAKKKLPSAVSVWISIIAKVV